MAGPADSDPVTYKTYRSPNEMENILARPLWA